MLKTEQRGSALWVWLNRPQCRNALNEQLATELTALFARQQQPASKGVRSVVLSGAGSAFCSGADLAWMTSAPAPSLAALHDALSAVRRCPLPVVARVTGAAAGGGAGLVAACDVAFSAGATARFAFPEARIGVVPALISGFVLPRLGRAAAARLLLSGRAVDGPSAAAMGLTNAHFGDVAAMDAEIARFCADVAASSPRSVAEIKRAILYRGDAMPRDEAAALLDAARRSPDGIEGVAAFREKRAPVWRSDC